MFLKTTEELSHEIESATNIEDYLAKNTENMIRISLSAHLNQLLKQKRISRAEVVRNSLLDRAYVYQIFAGEKTPSRDKLLSIAFGMCLTDEETQTMLKLSGNSALYVRDVRDSIILFSLQHNMNISATNDLLYDHGFKLLGSQE